MKYRLMKVFVKTFLIILFIVHNNFAQNNISDNLTIFKVIVDKSISEYLENVLNDQSLIMNIKGDKDFKWIFEEKIHDYAKKHDIKRLYKYPLKNNVSQTAPLLEIVLQKNNVSFKSGSLIPSNSVIRTVALDYYITLTAPDNQILLTDQYSNTYQDTIKTSQIDKLQDSNYPFTIGKKNRRFSKLIEPLMVISVTGTIIYIFYAFRSK